MKIILINKFYYPRGGDCIYTLNLEKLLRDSGHEVAIFASDYTDNYSSEWSSYFPSSIDFSGGIISKFKAAGRAVCGNDVKIKFESLLDSFKPDIVHLNNIHSYISPIVAEISKSRGIPVIWTLHDYKLICPSYSCLCRGDVCERCFSDKSQVLRKRCMKGSLPASLIGYIEALNWSKERIEKSTDLYICPSRFMKNKMIQGGFKESKLIHLSNFAPELPKLELDKSDYYCYIGRLSPEKGVKTLLEAAKKINKPLVIIGGGPLLEELKAQYSSSLITFTGALDPQRALDIVSKARFSVTPSEWYENNPLSIIESLCMGTPVLGADIGGIPELIEDRGNGLTFTSRNVDDLKLKIQEMYSISFDNEDIASKAMVRFDKENYYNELIKIYNNILR
ncbi:MAG: glycosyltransferase [Bacteroidales bacterium]